MDRVREHFEVLAFLLAVRQKYIYQLLHSFGHSIATDLLPWQSDPVESLGVAKHTVGRKRHQSNKAVKIAVSFHTQHRRGVLLLLLCCPAVLLLARAPAWTPSSSHGQHSLCAVNPRCPAEALCPVAGEMAGQISHRLQTAPGTPAGLWSAHHCAGSSAVPLEQP